MLVKLINQTQIVTSRNYFPKKTLLTNTTLQNKYISLKKNTFLKNTLDNKHSSK